MSFLRRAGFVSSKESRGHAEQVFAGIHLVVVVRSSRATMYESGLAWDSNETFLVYRRQLASNPAFGLDYSC